MKAAFFYSKSAGLYEAFRGKFFVRQIDGLEFTETTLFEDDEEIKPVSAWQDNVLVTVVENVDVRSNGLLDYTSNTIKGRIKINGKIQ